LLTAEAIRAVNRLIATRLEGHLRVLAALAAGDTEHLALAAAVPATAAVAAAAVALATLGSSATLTAARLVRETLLLMKGLVIRAKDKRRAAIGTGKGLVGEIHSTTS